MLNKIKEQKSKIIITVLVVICFGAIRAFEKQLFYDPFLLYFDSEFKNVPFPDFEGFRLFGGLLFRYFLNSVFSLILLYSLFQNMDILKFSVFLYLFFLVLLFAIFFLVLQFYPEGNWLLFYIRRFIIQPIFVLLFIPAFYYQQENLKK